jgi:hypothetical protein
MIYIEKRVINARLLPCPLPQERENPSPSPSKTCDWICRTALRKSLGVRSLFPLPGGEGQGEGGLFY